MIGVAATKPNRQQDFGVARPSCQGAPRGFELHAIEREYDLPADAAVAWEWLEDPATFTRGQIWPYRVEFTPDREGGATDFRVGGLSDHHGPGLSAAGQLTEIREGQYRELVYFYGSYVGSFRWIRPSRLEFWVDKAGPHARVRMRFESFVRTPLLRVWAWGLERFWVRFGHWMSESVQRRARRA